MAPYFLSFLLILSVLTATEAAAITTYWGQNGDEGSLADACNSGNYQNVNIAFLTTSSDGTTPVLDLAVGHCDLDAGTCTSISDDIRTCQTSGINVLLSLRVDSGSFSLSSTAEVEDVANYLLNSFLGGSSAASVFRPFGDAVLDGIDFYIKTDVGLHWIELLAFGLQNKFRVSAALPCQIQDANPDLPSQTGLRFFDYISVQFYDNPQCDYSGGLDALLASWNKWAAMFDGQVFMGLPASEAAAGSGYIPPDVMILQVLPAINGSAKYAGVMIWVNVTGSDPVDSGCYKSTADIYYMWADWEEAHSLSV